jgi:hypothetical protein
MEKELFEAHFGSFWVFSFCGSSHLALKKKWSVFIECLPKIFFHFSTFLGWPIVTVGIFSLFSVKSPKLLHLSSLNQAKSSELKLKSSIFKNIYLYTTQWENISITSMEMDFLRVKSSGCENLHPKTGPNAFLMRSERIFRCGPIRSERFPIVWGKCMAVAFGTHKLLLYMAKKFRWRRIGKIELIEETASADLGRFIMLREAHFTRLVPRFFFLHILEC